LIDAHIWLLFCGTVFGLFGIPGPNMLQALTTSVHEGFRQSLASSLGCLAASLLVNTISAAGLGAFMHAEPRWFDVIKYCGGAYLFYLGVSAIYHWRRTSFTPEPTLQEKRLRGTRLNMRRGFLIGISNPKLILFSVAFFPQFIDRHRDAVPQFVILFTTFMIGEAMWLVAYAAGGARLSALLARPRVSYAFNIASGLIFIAFSVAVIGTRL